MEAAEHWICDRSGAHGRPTIGRLEFQSPMRPIGVVEVHVLGKYALQMVLVPDERMVDSPARRFHDRASLDQRWPYANQEVE